MPSPSPSPSRAAEPQVRGERLIEKVLEAAIEEVATKGYAAVSIEDVAERAGVAKTTIYRRWPTKPELVHAALRRVADDVVGVVDTGSLRADLIAMMRAFRDFGTTARGATLMRMALADGLCGELAAMVRTIRKSTESMPLTMMARAVKRGELPRGTDPKLVLDTLFATLQHMLLAGEEPCDDRKLTQLVDLVLLGAQHGGGRPLRRAK